MTVRENKSSIQSASTHKIGQNFDEDKLRAIFKRVAAEELKLSGDAMSSA